MELKVKVASVSNSPLGNRIHLKLDASSTAHDKSAFIEKRRNSDSIDITVDDTDNSINQGDEYVLTLIKRTATLIESAGEAATPPPGGWPAVADPADKTPVTVTDENPTGGDAEAEPKAE